MSENVMTLQLRFPVEIAQDGPDTALIKLPAQSGPVLSGPMSEWVYKLAPDQHDDIVDAAASFIIGETIRRGMSCRRM